MISEVDSLKIVLSPPPGLETYLSFRSRACSVGLGYSLHEKYSLIWVGFGL